MIFFVNFPKDAEWKVKDKELLSSQAVTGKSQGKPSPAMPPVIESIHEDLSSDEEDEEENFRTKQLFLFAWQIAKGMVITILLFSEKRCFHSGFVFILQRSLSKTIPQARNKGN